MVCLGHCVPYMFVFRLSEWHWQLPDSSGNDTHLSKQCNGQTSIPYSAYGIIRSDAASKHQSASIRPSTVIIAQTDIARLSYVCRNVFAMSSIFFFICFLRLRIRSHSTFDYGHEMHLPYSFLPLLEFHALM